MVIEDLQEELLGHLMVLFALEHPLDHGDQLDVLQRKAPKDRLALQDAGFQEAIPFGRQGDVPLADRRQPQDLGPVGDWQQVVHL
ncbi:hypothetical protein D3C86_1696050 [compost metagenome]